MTETATTHVEFSAAHPLDEHNQLLLKHTHPEDWINPEPEGRYNLVVIGAGHDCVASCLEGDRVEITERVSKAIAAAMRLSS